MHYFEMPRLGAYLVLPLVHSSYYTQTAFAEAKKFEEESIEAERVKAEAQRVKEEQIKEAEDKGEPPPEFPEEPEEPPKVMQLTADTVKMVLCLDTLGTNTLFDETKYDSMIKLVEACADCKKRTEMKEIHTQAKYAIAQQKLADQQEDPEAGPGIAQLRTNTEAELAPAAENEKRVIMEGGYVPEEAEVRKEIVDKKYSFLKNKAIAEHCRDIILAYVNVCFTVPPEVLTTFACLAFLIGYTKEEVYPPNKKDLKWLRIKSLFEGAKANDFFAKLGECSLEFGRKKLTAEQKFSSIKAMKDTIPAEFTNEKAIEVDPSFEVLWILLTSALEYRKAELDSKQAEYDARKKAAEEREEKLEEEERLHYYDDDYEAESGSYY
jgi:hypothetical protein